jgi:predicted lipid-binding transport protein (Tim44 family)
MRRRARFLTMLAILGLALVPALADARPGGGASSGSRGARTYSAPPSTRTAPEAPRPMDRTMTAPTQPTAPAAAPGQVARPGALAPAARGGFFQRNPFLAGFLGAGLFGLLLGGGLFGGLSGLTAFLGLMLQVAIIALLAMLVIGFFRRRAQPAPAGVPGAMMRERMDPPDPVPAQGPTQGGGLARGPARPVDEIGVLPEDFAEFESMLKRVNEAWSRRDMATLSRIATPEMNQFFRDDIEALDARGWRNETRDLRLEQGDLAEAWREGARDYATVAMRFSLVDVTREIATGRVAEGDPEARQMATELWTFVRVPGGPWTLSAIQQVQAA